jgi:hypothetical protein
MMVIIKAMIMERAKKQRYNKKKGLATKRIQGQSNTMEVRFS